jgi:hypothetical protein
MRANVNGERRSSALYFAGVSAFDGHLAVMGGMGRIGL